MRLGTHGAHRALRVGRKPIRIEADGCIVYVEHTDHGTIVDVLSDGDRFAGEEYDTEVSQRQGPNGGLTVRVRNFRKAVTS